MRLIDADALLKGADKRKGAYGWIYSKEDIENAPTIEAEPVLHGEWIKKRFGRYVCSECGLIHIPILSKPNKRCPGCEAKMDGKETEE